MDLYFPQPGSFPISTVASILGFDVSPTPPSITKPSKLSSNSEQNNKNIEKYFVGAGKGFDPNTVPLKILAVEKNGRSKDPFQHIPPLGNFSQIWRSRRRQQGKQDDKVSDGDDLLDYIDSSWSRILDQFSNVNAKDTLKLATDMAQLQSYILSSDLIEEACSFKLISRGVKFRFAEIGDENKLFDFNKNSGDGRYESIQAITAIIKCCSQRIIIAEGEDGALQCFIHYSFNWYMLLDDGKSKDKDEPNTDTNYSSITTNKRSSQKETPELVIFINKVSNGGLE